MRRLAAAWMALCLLLSASAGAQGRSIAARTAVTKWGQMPLAFEISGQALPEGVEAADFAISGEATAWAHTVRIPSPAARRPWRRRTAAGG